MQVSALIPTYNSSATIRGTLESVLNQSDPADEVLVMDDGSTDDTVGILNSYRPRITVLQQQNGGVANARNSLSARATGDLLAFLDHDDAWHPDYLKTQKKLFAAHPGASAFFTGHATFSGSGDFDGWEKVENFTVANAEEIPPVEFIRRYHLAIGDFMSMSFCCVPKAALRQLGDRPFCEEVSGVDDCHLLHRLATLGPIVFSPARLAAYRLSSHSQSADRVKGAGLSVRAMELLKMHFRAVSDAELRKTYQWSLAMQRREYGKVLMSAGKPAEARKQFFLAMGSFGNPVSMMKSMRLLACSYLPTAFQPRWLPARTEVRASAA